MSERDKICKCPVFRRNETAIGYRIVSQAKDESKSYGVHTNPKKSQPVTFAPDDKVIVLAES